MKHLIVRSFRFQLKLTIYALIVLAVCTFSQDAGAQSFSIPSSKVYNPVVSPYYTNIIIDNLAGKTQYLNVTIVNSDSSLQFAMYDVNLRFAPLGNSLVLHKDSVGKDQGTLLFSHPFSSNKPFTTLVILSDASNTTRDTIIFNIHDSVPPPKKKVMSISPASPLTLLVGNEATKSFDLTFTNLTSDNYQVTIDQSGSSNLFSIPTSSFDLSGKAGANTYVLTITYRNAGQNFPDSGIVVFTPSVQGGKSELLQINVIDTVKTPPYISIYTQPFYNVPIGSKNCDNITIPNTNDIPVIITALVITGADAAEFSLNPAPSLPITIDKNSKLLIPFCFTAPNTRHTNSRAELLVTYHSEGTGNVEVKGYFSAITGSCVTFSPDSIQYGDLIAGGSAEGYTTITNTLDNPITLTGASWDYISPANAFTLIGTTFPITLAGKESKTLTFRYTPPSNAKDYSVGHYIIKYTGANDSECTSAALNFVGHIVDPSDTSTKSYNLFPNIKTALPILSSQQTTSKDFIFVNNTTHPVKVISISVKDGTHFKVLAPKSTDLPISLQPYAQMKVTVSFDANTNGYYNDELDIVTENGLVSQAFNLQGIRKNGVSSGVTMAHFVEPEIRLNPNPTQRLVAINVSGGNIRTVEIYDMLGNIIASHQSSGEWIWDGTSINGQLASAGTYFVRVAGNTEEGISFVRTTKLVVNK